VNDLDFDFSFVLCLKQPQKGAKYAKIKMAPLAKE